jgi:hypothetical protein
MYGLEDGVVELEAAVVERAWDAEPDAGSEMAALGVFQGLRPHTKPGLFFLFSNRLVW